MYNQWNQIILILRNIFKKKPGNISRYTSQRIQAMSAKAFSCHTLSKKSSVLTISKSTETLELVGTND